MIAVDTRKTPMRRFCVKLFLLLAISTQAGCGARAGGVNIWTAISNDDATAIAKYAAAGGDLNCKNFSGNTPLMVAMESGSSQAFEELLKQGADPNFPMKDQRTVVAWASMERETTWLELALKHGGDPNQESSSRGSKHLEPPLGFAITNGEVAHAKLLIEHGADIDLLGPTQHRPLLTAMGNGRYDIVLLLLESGADYKAADTKPWSFLEEMHRIYEGRDFQLKRKENREGFEKVKAWLEKRGVEIRE